MQQYSIELPKQRVELYTVVTRTLLENRNLIKNIKPTPEAQAIQRLGPIAYTIFEVAVGTVFIASASGLHPGWTNAPHMGLSWRRTR